MARPLRILQAGGRYHVTARGNERKDIFRDDRDRLHLLELFAELPARFGTRLHAYVLMPNHFHLLLETPEPNLSRAGQWLNVSYSVWFNRRHQRSGHLFQGRFAAVLIGDAANFQEVGRYVHLNPVRVKTLGLDKAARGAQRQGVTVAPTPEVVAARLRTLREWRWSSYPVYAGCVAAPAWLATEVLGTICGGRTLVERRAAIRRYVEEAVREGLAERPWDRLVGRLLLGSAEWVQRMRKGLTLQGHESPGTQELCQRPTWEQIVQAVEQVKGERWADFRDRHGDWSRDAVLYLARRSGRLTLAEAGRQAGGMDYASVGTAVARFARRLEKDRQLQDKLSAIQHQLSNI